MPASVDERPKKLAKLTKLRKSIPLTTKSALHQILQHIKDEGLPEMMQPKQMTEGCQAVLDQCNGYGPFLLDHFLHCTNGEKKKITLVNFLSFVHGAYKAGGGFHSLLKATLMASTGPLSLILYADEITPGNVLAHQLTRKIWCLYLSCKEFGIALQNQDAWITVGMIRSSLVSLLDGHLSQICSALLSSIFRSPYANVVDLGLQLQEPAGSEPVGKRLQLRLGFLLMDGQAAKFAWSTKGDAGSRFCQQCANVFQVQCADDNDLLQEQISEISKFIRFRQLHLVTDQEIFQSWDRMADRHGRCTKGDLQMWEQATGITFSPHAMLARTELRPLLQPTSQNCWDWMHALVSNGIVNIAMFQLIDRLDQWQFFAGYFAQFVLPKDLNTIQLPALFQTKRVAKHKQHKKINSSASELLTLTTIMAHYLRVVCVPANACLEEAHLVLALALFIDLLQATWFGTVTPQQLQDCAEDILRRWKGLNWKWLKKHHWILHFHQMLAHHGCVPACFCMERKNKTPGRIATNIQNLRTFEKSLYLEISTMELQRLALPDSFAAGPAILRAKTCPKKLQSFAASVWNNTGSVVASNHARIQHGTCSKRDVVYLQSQTGRAFDAAQVLAFLGDDEHEFAILNMLRLTKQCETFAEWQESDVCEAVPLTQLWTTVVFAKSGDKFTTLTPWRWR
eukprot:Skav230731  [mRNA]  locus=scaffold401:510054:512096:- [translate_table: standard]